MLAFSKNLLNIEKFELTYGTHMVLYVESICMDDSLQKVQLSLFKLQLETEVQN